jgi:hypothetical protein
MKHFMLIIAALAFINASAQTKPDEKELGKHRKMVEKSKEKKTVIYSLDTIFNAGVPYAVMKELANESSTYNDYDVFSLNGKHLINVKVEWRNVYENGYIYSRVYYVYDFLDSKQKGEISPKLTMKVYEDIVEAGLITNNAIDPAAESKFITAHPLTSKNVGVAVGNGKKSKDGFVVLATFPEPVARNRNAEIKIENKEIKQDGKLIGSYTMINGAGRKVIAVFAPDGTKLAEAINEGATMHDWKIFTMKDVRQYPPITSDLGKDVKDVVDFLISTNYL